MLRWYVDAELEAATVCCSAKLIEKVEVCPEKFQTRYEQQCMVAGHGHNKTEGKGICCFHDLDEDPSIVCDHCLSWSHIKCYD